MYQGSSGTTAGEPVALRPAATAAAPLSVGWTAAPDPLGTDAWGRALSAADFGVRVDAVRPPAPEEIPAVVTDAFLDASERRAARAWTSRSAAGTCGSPWRKWSGGCRRRAPARARPPSTARTGPLPRPPTAAVSCWTSGPSTPSSPRTAAPR
ncbi:hypothetical protein ACFQ60_19435 [Streptomyces zhihengii]